MGNLVDIYTDYLVGRTKVFKDDTSKIYIKYFDGEIEYVNIFNDKRIYYNYVNVKSFMDRFLLIDYPLKGYRDFEVAYDMYHAKLTKKVMDYIVNCIYIIYLLFIIFNI